MEQSYKVKLNSNLLKSQKVSPEQETKIRTLHITLLELFKSIENKYLKVSQARRNLWVDEISNIEYEMQKNWNFKVSKDFHTHWNKVPGCDCPRLDNSELVGTSYRIFSEECIFHGSDSRKYLND